MDEMNNERSAAVPSEKTKRTKAQKLELIKTASMAVIILIILIFETIAWFTIGGNDAMDKLTMADNSLEYDISFLENGKDGIYTEEYRDMIGDPSALVWQMTAENNMDNLDEKSNGIYPGAYGVISFYITPKVSDLDLALSFEVVGVKKKSETESSSDTESAADTLETLDSAEIPAKYLNGHILLFGERIKGEDGYTYSEPILSDKDMKRVLKKSYTDKKDEPQLVNIYWVWPETLSTLIDARNSGSVAVTEKPFTENDDYNKISQNVTSFPSYYLQFESEDESTSITEENIVADYGKYGGYYDLADNNIGGNIDYLLLKLSVTKTDSDGK